jgi:hypothetical protein
MNRPVNCYLCETGLDKIVISLNKKLLGRKIARFYCLNCLAEYLEVTPDELLAKVEEFKAQGCKLFK